ncbi:MAG: hypothetical protein HYU99_03405 [Deltaproteobacteria bacterium]|nr:hypothetical protein [Deltaproteobacteria bacterium]
MADLFSPLSFAGSAVSALATYARAEVAEYLDENLSPAKLAGEALRNGKEYLDLIGDAARFLPAPFSPSPILASTSTAGDGSVTGGGGVEEAGPTSGVTEAPPADVADPPAAAPEDPALTDEVIGQRLQRYGLQNNEFNRRAYRQAYNIGKRDVPLDLTDAQIKKMGLTDLPKTVKGVPVWDIDHTNFFWRQSIPTTALDYVIGQIDGFLERMHSPLRWKGEAPIVVNNQWGAGRQAMLLGFADGSEKVIPVDSRGFPWRLADLSMQSPAFAKALLGIEPEEMNRMKIERGHDATREELIRKVRTAPNIFTYENLPAVVKEAFDQYTRNPEEMTPAEWLVVALETRKPGSSKTKPWYYHVVGERVMVALHSLGVGHVDDRRETARNVTTPAARSRIVLLTNPEEVGEFAWGGAATIQADLVRGTSTHQTSLILQAVERLTLPLTGEDASSGETAQDALRTGEQVIQIPLSRGAGEKSVIVLRVPKPLPEGSYDSSADTVIMYVPSVDFNKQYFGSKSQARGTMVRAHLDGATPPMRLSTEYIRYLASKGGFSMLEMGGSLYLAKSLVGEEMDWREVGPEVGIFSAFGLVGGAMGELRFYRGPFANILTPFAAMSAVQVYYHREVTPVANAGVAGGFALAHWGAHRFITQPFIVQPLGARAIRAMQAGEAGKARLVQMGMRGAAGAVSFGLSTVLFTGLEWWARDSRIEYYENFRQNITDRLLNSYVDYRKKASVLEAKAARGEAISSGESGEVDRLFSGFEENLGDSANTPYLVAGDFPDIEGKHYIESQIQYATLGRELEQEGDEYVRTTLYEKGFSVGQTDLIKAELDKYFKDSGKLEELNRAKQTAERATKVLEARRMQKVIVDQEHLEEAGNEILGRLEGKVSLEEVKAVFEGLKGYELAYVCAMLLEKERGRRGEFLKSLPERPIGPELPAQEVEPKKGLEGE